MAVVVFAMGYFLYSKEMILWLNTLSPLMGVVFYELVFFMLIYTGSNLGFFIYEPRRVPLIQAFGLYLITSAILMTISWESPYVNIVTKGNAENVSIVYFQTWDGVAWNFVDRYFSKANLETKRVIAFALIPGLLTLIGGFFVTGRIPI